MTTRLFYLYINNQQQGPYDIDQIRGMWNSGAVTADTHYWQEGMSDWEQVHSLISQPQIPPPSLPIPLPLPQAKQPNLSHSSPIHNKYKSTTLLLCIFLGWLGAHRFYVGRWMTGTIQLLTFGGYGIWWLIDFILIVFNNFTTKGGEMLKGSEKIDAQLQQVSNSNSAPSRHLEQAHDSNSAPSSVEEWIMKPKEAAGWEYFLDFVFLKSHQLASIEQKDNILTVKVRSGRQCVFPVGQFKCTWERSYYISKRVFRIKGTGKNRQKITFVEFSNETRSWWLDLIEKLNASHVESHFAKNKKREIEIEKKIKGMFGGLANTFSTACPKCKTKESGNILQTQVGKDFTGTKVVPRDRTSMDRTLRDKVFNLYKITWNNRCSKCGNEWISTGETREQA